MRKSITRKVMRKSIILFLLIVIVFSIFALMGNIIAHSVVFSRADYDEYDTEKFVTYDDFDKYKYPREAVKIKSGENELNGYLYGAENKNGLMIISPGHRDCNDIKLYETKYFIDAGWSVLCYDYTGCYTSEGSDMRGYSQCVHDLHAVLDYVESEERFKQLPIALFGHSMGAYASAAVLQYKHNVKAAVIASGFDSPREQWLYSIQRYTGPFYYLFVPYTNLYIDMKYRDDSDLSAIDGINSVDIPILIISGTKDIFYGNESPIYKKRDKVINPNCTFELMTEEGHNGHYDYLLIDEALDYEKSVDSKEIEGKIDKWLYMEHDEAVMDKINDFLLESVIH